ncbi:MAG TPA: hypothetical protein VMI75_26705, partial [Polyangiaceae bacterium]|nr:hypothetical protein [Polyangiaceae bacterium]
NTELVARLAHLQRARPRSESLRRLEGQLVLPLGGLMVPIVPKPAPSTGDQKKTRKGRHPGRAAPSDHLQRVPVFNRVPHCCRARCMKGSSAGLLILTGEAVAERR